MTLLTHGTGGINVDNTLNTTTVTKTLTYTAGRCIVVEACGFQNGGGTRTLSASSDLDGSLGAADSSNGTVAGPSYVWHLNNLTGGSTVITITASGTMLNLMVLIREYAGGSLTLAQQAKAALSATTAWDSGAVTTGVSTELLVGFGYSTSRNNLTISSCDDGNGNSYTNDQTELTSSGESCASCDFMGTLISASRKANATMAGASTGEMHFVSYAAAVAGFTAKQRKTLSGIGTRVGTRQVRG